MEEKKATSISTEDTDSGFDLTIHYDDGSALVLCSEWSKEMKDTAKQFAEQMHSYKKDVD